VLDKGAAEQPEKVDQLDVDSRAEARIWHADGGSRRRLLLEGLNYSLPFGIDNEILEHSETNIRSPSSNVLARPPNGTRGDPSPTTLQEPLP
jgi:hypothetical protein